MGTINFNRKLGNPKNQYQLIDGAHRMESLKNLKLANPIRYERVEKVACRVYNDLTEHESIAVATCKF